MINSKLDTGCNRLFALLLLSVSQFQTVSPNWLANSRSFDIASSAVSIDGKTAKKTSCASMPFNPPCSTQPEKRCFAALGGFFLNCGKQKHVMLRWILKNDNVVSWNFERGVPILFFSWNDIHFHNQKGGFQNPWNPPLATPLNFHFAPPKPPFGCLLGFPKTPLNLIFFLKCRQFFA